MLLELDLGLRCESITNELGPHDLAELRLREKQEVLVAPAQDRQRRDHAGLRVQEQCLTSLPRSQRSDVVGDHPLEVALGLRPCDANEGPRPTGDRPRRNALHPD